MGVLSLTRDELNELAERHGFDRAGVAALDPDRGNENDYLEHWIDAGYAGEMDYLKRRNDTGTLLRSHVNAALPWARSVLVCASSYNAPGPQSLDSAAPTQGWIARYAWAGKRDPDTGALGPSDYHDTLLARLRALEADLHERIPETFESKSYVDTGPLIERDLAQRAGIGWTGKNTCTLNQQLGSFFFLGCIVTSLDVPARAASLAAVDRCGTCRRCIDACPTDALIAPRQMDASRCISYLTIEKRGSIAEPLRAGIGRQVFGCDICQEVCPWNRRAPIATSIDVRPELVNPELEWLAELSPEEFNQQFRHSPVKRTKHSGIQRNVAIAMGNSREPRYSARLEQWSAGADEVLAEAARWALARIEEAQQGSADKDTDAERPPEI